MEILYNSDEEIMDSDEEHEARTSKDLTEDDSDEAPELLDTRDDLEGMMDDFLEKCSQSHLGYLGCLANSNMLSAGMSSSATKCDPSSGGSLGPKSSRLYATLSQMKSMGMAVRELVLSFRRARSLVVIPMT